jgi:hypothetical protein
MPLRGATRARLTDNLAAHERARADATGKHALRDESLVRKRHRIARHIETARQFACRRKAFSWTEPTVQYCVEELTVDPRRQIPAPLQRDMNVHASHSEMAQSLLSRLALVWCQLTS